MPQETQNIKINSIFKLNPKPNKKPTNENTLPSRKVTMRVNSKDDEC